jgi:hypothetical protein
VGKGVGTCCAHLQTYQHTISVHHSQRNHCHSGSPARPAYPACGVANHPCPVIMCGYVIIHCSTQLYGLPSELATESKRHIHRHSCHASHFITHCHVHHVTYLVVQTVWG